MRDAETNAETNAETTEASALLGDADTDTTVIQEKSRAHEGYAYLVMFIIAGSIGVALTSQVQLNVSLACRDILPRSVIDGPDWESLCHKNPAVQRHSAAITRNNMLAMGLSITAVSAYMGSLSDRIGRTKLLAVTALGGVVHMLGMVLMIDSPFLLSNYRTTLVCLYMIHGLSGGMGVMWALSRAYIADVTSVGSRANSLSRGMAFVFIGIFIGPAAGSFLVRYFNSPTRPALLASAVGHVIAGLFALFVMPESVPRKRQLEAWESHNERVTARKERIERRIDRDIQSPALLNVLIAVISAEEAIYELLEPVKILYPERRAAMDKDPENRSILLGPASEEWSKTRGRFWSLVLLVFADTFSAMHLSMVSYEILYTSLRFDWGTRASGYYMSYMSFIKAAFLLVLFPIITKHVHGRKNDNFTERAFEEEAVAAFDVSYVPPPEAFESGISIVSEGAPGSPIKTRNPTLDLRRRYSKTFAKVFKDTSIDLWFAWISSSFFVVGEVLQGMNGGRVWLFVMAMTIRQITSATNPSIQSVSLAFVPRKDAGRLMGAVSLVDTVASTLIGPILFSYVYIKSADILPEAIFFMSAAIGFLAFVFLSCVRIPGWASGGSIPTV